MRASLVIAIVVAITGCLSGRARPGSTLPPRPCTYHVSRSARVSSLLAVGARYRAVITATVTDSSGQPLPTAWIARMPGGPGAYTDAQGRAVVRLTERDVRPTDSTNIMVRRVGSTAMAIPVRIAAGDSVDIVASMCRWSYGHPDPNVRRVIGPEHDHSGIGSAIGAVVGTVVGHLFARDNCGQLASRCTGLRGAAGGAAVGALVGYGIGHLVTSYSACMPPDAESRGILADMRALVDTNDVTHAALQRRLGIPAVPREQVYVVTDERTCRRARQALDSLIHAGNPSAPGLKNIPSVYVIRAGSIIDVETPSASASHIFDARTWKFLAVLVVPD